VRWRKRIATPFGDGAGGDYVGMACEYQCFCIGNPAAFDGPQITHAKRVWPAIDALALKT